MSSSPCESSSRSGFRDWPQSAPFACRITVAALAATVAFATGCGSDEPFPIVKVTGKITYTDGSLIPANGIVLVFFPQVPPLDDKTYPRHGLADVNVEDGTFDTVATHRYGDGLTAGKNKVMLRVSGGGSTEQRPEVPTDGESLFTESTSQLVPSEYLTVQTTPLAVDTKDNPLTLLVEKPRTEYFVIFRSMC